MDTIREMIDDLKHITPLNPRFELQKRNVLREMEYALSNNEITVDTFEDYKTCIESLQLQSINSSIATLTKYINSEYKIKINLNNLLLFREKLDYIYVLIFNDFRGNSIKNGVSFVDDITDSIRNAVTSKKYDEAFFLFYFLTCYLRCHDFNSLSKLNPTLYAVVFSEIYTQYNEIFKNNDLNSMKVFTDFVTDDLTAKIVSNIVFKILSSKNRNEVSIFVNKLITTYYDGITYKAVAIMIELQKIIDMFFDIEDDIGELIKMVDAINRYSNYSFIDIIGEQELLKIINFIINYYKEFDDISCYNFIVKNYLYYSNAITNNDITAVKSKLKCLLDKYGIVDYDNILTE